MNAVDGAVWPTVELLSTVSLSICKSTVVIVIARGRLAINNCVPIGLISSMSLSN